MSREQKSTRIVLTGGGTAGHVMPHLAILPALKNQQVDVLYVGSKGIEQSLAQGNGIAFKKIAAGKLRRYVSVENFFDIFKVCFGFLQALVVLCRFRPKLVFSKGGYVGVPVAFAARVLGIPLVVHESDLTPGLANKHVLPFAKKILYSFPDSLRFLPKDKAIFTGSPIRADLFLGSKAKGRQICQFSESEKKVLLIVGGSLGAEPLNKAVEAAFHSLTARYLVCHVTGKGKKHIQNQQGYASFEFVGEELKHLVALADLVLCRGGANTLFAILALNKPMLIVPFEKGSRGDQIDNAKVFAARGWGQMLFEKELTAESLLLALANLEKEAPTILAKQKDVGYEKSSERVMAVLSSFW